MNEIVPSTEIGPRSRLPLTASEKTLPSSLPNTTCIGCPSSSTVLSTAAPVVLSRTLTDAEPEVPLK